VAVEGHLKACSECRSLLETMDLAERAVARAESTEPPEGYFANFASRVANRIAGESLATRPPPKAGVGGADSEVWLSS